jgi:DNA-binding transcriptional MerR regulator
MAANPQPAPQPNKLTIQGVAQLLGFMVSTIRKWQRDGKVPPAPTDGNYSPEYVAILQTYRKNALSAQIRSRWAKLTPEERTEVAQKQWTPERKRTQSITMRNVRLGLTGLTPEELEEWNTNSKNAADTQEVRKAKVRGAEDLWAKRKAAKAALVEAEQRVVELREQLQEAEREAIDLKARLGRPRKGPEDPMRLRPRILELKAELSWPQVTRIMNKETGTNMSAAYWRSLLEGRPATE